MYKIIVIVVKQDIIKILFSKKIILNNKNDEKTSKIS